MRPKHREGPYVEAVEELQLLDEARDALRHGRTEEAARALAEARRRRLRNAPPIPVSAASKLLTVSEPTVRSWLDTGLLEDASVKPRAVRIESLVRVLRTLTEVRRAGQDCNVRRALLARLDDELTLQDERLQRSTARMRRGRERPVQPNRG